MSGDDFADEGVIQGAGRAGQKTLDWVEMIMKNPSDA